MQGKVVLTLQPVAYASDLADVPATRVCRASTLVLIEEELSELPVPAIQRRIAFYLHRGQAGLGAIKHVVNLQRKKMRSTLKLHTLQAAHREVNVHGLYSC